MLEDLSQTLTEQGMTEIKTILPVLVRPAKERMKQDVE